ncbi:MAG TPA: FGGY-family carbohydrate kinase [Acidimicrobiia bacterium]|nr:FGGY-family carbohydrate kinase [Acidimicrobiia bacterium]
MSVLVVDVGTSSVRAAVVHDDTSVHAERAVPLLPDSPVPGLVELDASAIARAVLDVARASLDAHGGAGSVDAVGIASQRSSTIVWDRATGTPLAPGLGWQDLRTVGRCLELQGQGLRVAPNASATKLEHLLDLVDPARERDVCFGTVDTWVAWTLSEGALHVTDATNAGVTGLMTADGSEWSAPVLDALRIPRRVLPAIVDSSGVVGEATALPGAPPIAALAGDQQASLVGQGCVRPGDAKITFGTGAMLDVCLARRPSFTTRGPQGSFPIVTWRRGGRDAWGVEAIMLAAGTNVEWLRDDLGLVEDAADSDAVAAQCDDTGDVWFVPALLGLGTPYWDHGARGTLLGLTRGTGRPQVVRAVLEGIAHRGADLVDAAEADGGVAIGDLRVDGGMSANATFVQALADASQRAVEVSPVAEATTLGAAFLAGLAIGTWHDEAELAATWSPRARVEPRRVLDRDRWRDACERARRWIPDLSSIDF